MKTIQQKIQSVSKKVSTALKIGYVLMALAACLSTVGFFILLLGNGVKDSFMGAFDIVSKNGTVLNISEENLKVLFLYSIAYSLLMGGILFTVWQIFRDISRECTPFNAKHTGRIKAVSIMFIVVSAAGSCFDSLADLYSVGKTTWNVDVMGIVFGALIYCIALVYDYGCELQQQADETL